MEISHNTIHRWKGLNEIYHVTKYGHPVLRWAPCAQSFVLNIPTFYFPWTPLLMRPDPFAQQLFAPVSTRGESTCGRQRPKNTPVLTRKWPPGLCFSLIRRALRRLSSRCLWIGQIPNPWGVILEKLVFLFFGLAPPGCVRGIRDRARKIPQEMAHLVVRSVSLLTASGRLYTHEEKWFFGSNSPRF